MKSQFNLVINQNIDLFAQYYAPTMMAYARDFWTLRYTSIMDNGCFVVRLISFLEMVSYAHLYCYQ